MSVNARLNDAGLATQLARLSQDQERRTTELLMPRVLSLGADDNVGSTPPAGTAMLVFERRGEGFLADLEARLAAKNLKGLQELFSQRREEIAGRSQLSFEQAIDLLIGLPTYFDFEYGAKTLAVGVGLPSYIGFGTLLFPTNGGKLNDSDFKVRLYSQAGNETKADIDYLVVKREAKLSELEKKVVAMIPSNQTEQNISVGGPVHILPCVIVSILIMTVAGTLCAQIDQEMARARLSEELVDRLGAQASARELLAMRREIYERM